MSATKFAVAAALIAALSLPVAVQAQGSETEKCFDVAKAGKNDCQTATSSGAGTSKKDGQTEDAWLTVPKGTCEKIIGGSLTAKKA